MAPYINTVVSLVGVFISGLTGLGSGLRVVSEPDPFSDLTRELKISCVADGAAYVDKWVISIHIMPHTDDRPTVVIDLKQQIKKGDSFKDNMKAKGHIDNQGKKSYLTLTIENPNKKDAGLYRCQEFYMNSDLQMTEGNEVGKVTYNFLLSTLPGPSTTTTPAPTTPFVPSKKACHDREWEFWDIDNTCLRAFGTFNRTEQLPWSEARKACQALGADLVQIHDWDKNDFVYAMVYWHKYGNPWIGIKNYGGDEFKFKYVDGTPVSKFQPWYPDQPTGEGDDCVRMYTGKNYNTRWYDSDCSVPQPYVCSIA